MNNNANKQCPACGSKDVIPIAYGYPGPAMYQESMEGKIFLGGCCLDIDSPASYCKSCENMW